MKDRMKDDAMQKEYHELKKVSRNHEHDNSNHLNDIFNKHTKSMISDETHLYMMLITNLLSSYSKV